LTMRKRELLAVLADGWTNLQIATRTGISENTVKYHLKNLYDKLDVRNRAMAVALYASEKSRGSHSAQTADPAHPYSAPRPARRLPAGYLANRMAPAGATS